MATVDFTLCKLKDCSGLIFSDRTNFGIDPYPGGVDDFVGNLILLDPADRKEMYRYNVVPTLDGAEEYIVFGANGNKAIEDSAYFCIYEVHDDTGALVSRREKGFIYDCNSLACISVAMADIVCGVNCTTPEELRLQTPSFMLESAYAKLNEGRVLLAKQQMTAIKNQIIMLNIC